MSGNIIDHCISNAEYSEIQVALKEYIKLIREQGRYNVAYTNAYSAKLSRTLSKIEFFVNFFSLEKQL